jgi:hypothetical protein
MTYKILLLLTMVFCHIVDDYYLQGWFVSAKQKMWWEKNAPESLYKYDYIVALFMHSFSWTFSIMLMPTLYIIIMGSSWYPLLFIGNILIHMYVDDLKANKRKISLFQDQIIHLIQIIWTWYCFIF